MEIYDCLAKDLDVWGHHFLEASAGTGKTFTIEHITVRLLLDPKAIDIDQILIVTFTRAATRELKLRLQRRLRECLKALLENDVKYPYLDLTDEEKAFAIQRLQLALSCFDRAQIFTIHSFCHRLLSERCFEADSALNQPGPDDQNYQGFLQQQTKDFIRTGLKPELFLPSQIERAIQVCGGSCEKLAARMPQLMNEQLTFAPASLETLTKINAALVRCPTKHLAEQFEAMVSHFKGMSDRSGKILPAIAFQIELLSKVIEKGRISMDELDLLLGSDPCLVLQLKSDNRKKRKSDQDLPVLHQWIQEELCPLFEAATDPKQILQHMAMLCKQRIDAAKSLHDMISPDDILLRLDQALEKPFFSDKIRGQFQAAIIDEFQDTDPIQWSIFQKLFLSTENRVPAFYLVGDPKQSIYAFRKADLYTYLGASEKLGKENRKILRTNYRSSKELIEGLNTLFGHENASQWLQLPSAHLALEYIPLLAHQKTEPFKDDKKAVHLLKIEQTNSRSVPSKDLEEHVLFPYIATQIKALNLDFSAFAVLIKDRYQATRLARFFKRVGIPCVSKSGVSVCSSKAYLLLDAFLQAVIRPNALSDIKRLLSAPIISWDYLALLTENFDEEIQAVSAKLNEFKTIWEKEGFAAVINAALSCGFGSKRNLRELLAVEKENTVDFFHLCELLLEEEGKKPHTMRDLYKGFKRLKEINPDHHPQLKQREVHESCAVTIMTTHMSKGLEFDVVFALGMGCRHNGSENRELEAEKYRLFYVAMTRARRRVYLPVIVTPNKTPAPGCESPAEKFFANWNDIEELSSESISIEMLKSEIKCPGFTEVSKEQLMPPKEHRLHIEKRLVSSYSGLVKTTFDALAPRQPKESAEVNIHTMPAGSKIGTLLHHLLEKVIETGLYKEERLDKILDFVQNKVADFEPWTGVIAELIYRIMRIPIDGFCLKDVPKDSMVHEMEFLLPLKSDLLIKGFADLIFQYRGKTYIIDWKSNWLGPAAEDYSSETLEKAMAHHDYFLQARIYGAAVVKWLQKYETKPPNDFYGGAFYVFLRGIDNEQTHGIYHFRNH